MLAKFLIIMTLVVIGFSSSYAQGDNIYCYDTYDEFRQLRYWARARVTIRDYHYGSGDARSLKLTHMAHAEDLFDETSIPIKDYFLREFSRLIKRNLPFHDTDEGSKNAGRNFLRNTVKTRTFLKNGWPMRPHVETRYMGQISAPYTAT